MFVSNGVHYRGIHYSINLLYFAVMSSLRFNLKPIKGSSFLSPYSLLFC